MEMWKARVETKQRITGSVRTRAGRLEARKTYGRTYIGILLAVAQDGLGCSNLVRLGRVTASRFEPKSSRRRTEVGGFQGVLWKAKTGQIRAFMGHADMRTYIELIVSSHQRVMKQVPIYLGND
jgi:hypothetical protein